MRCHAARLRRRAGLTMLEVVVSSAILSILALAIMGAVVPLSESSSETAIALDMDRIALKVMTELRRDIRRSGYEDGTAKFGRDAVGDAGDLTAAANQLVLSTRVDQDRWTDELATPATVTWSLATDADGTHLQRRVGTAPAARMASQVGALQFLVAANDSMCQVTLTLTRVNPNDRLAPISRTYVDRIEMMNR